MGFSLDDFQIWKVVKVCRTNAALPKFEWNIVFWYYLSLSCYLSLPLNLPLFLSTLCICLSLVSHKDKTFMNMLFKDVKA